MPTRTPFAARPRPARPVLYRHSRGAFGEAMADQILAAAHASLQVWGEQDLSFPDLAEDIAIEARLALALTEEISELDERIAVIVRERDPHGTITSAPGVGAITGAVILGRLGDASRFQSLAAARSFSGLIPSLDSSGITGRHGGPTKRGDALLREALFISANQARRLDPTLAAKYHRLMTKTGKHHNSALCHIATTLLTRVVACWREPVALPAPRRPRPPSHHRPGTRDHRRPLPDPRTHPTGPHHHRDGPAK